MMAVEATSKDYVTISAPELVESVVRVLVGEGARRADAEIQAEVLVEADLRAQHSHGVQRLPVLVGRLRQGLIRSGGDLQSTWSTPAFLRVDGGHAFGPVVAHHAVERIIPRAKATGVAMAAVRHANHMGMLAPYVEAMAERGLIGLAFTTSEALVHPWGGARALVGTNPIAIAVPTEGEALVLDMSTAAVSMGKVLSHLAADLPIPEGWAVDESGAATTDARAASRGAISPFGGAKGYALAVALEAAIGLLTETAFGTDVKGTLDTEHASTKGDLFIAISPQTVDLTATQRDLTSYLDELRASGTTSTQVSVPGDRARRERQARLTAGIPLPSRTWQQVAELLDGSAR